jgi:cytolysin (calcineurin-like family phosphatase)
MDMCHFRNHLHRLKLVPTPLCLCGQSAQTTEHILQHCHLFSQLRKEHWPTETHVKNKLFGSIDELRKTVTYIQKTGLIV